MTDEDCEVFLGSQTECNQGRCGYEKRCGDGIKDEREACDPGVPEHRDSCRDDCTLIECGDGIREGGEECDINDPACTSNCQLGIGLLSNDTLSHSCAAVGGAVRCWGANWAGQAGIGHSASVGIYDYVAFGDIARATDVAPTQLVTGGEHSCALTDGTVRCWGGNIYGQVGVANQAQDAFGDGQNELPTEPVALGGRVAQIAAGAWHTCALLENGAVRCWGWNHKGQLGAPEHYANLKDDCCIGDNDGPQDLAPVDLGGTAVFIAAGRNHNCAIMSTGDVRCWGSNSQHQSGAIGSTSTNIGDDPGEMPPPSVKLGAAALRVAAGAGHTCALLFDNTMRCWGNNEHGQLGTNESEVTVGDDEQPANGGRVKIISDDLQSQIVELAAGDEHTCVLLEDPDSENQSMHCWGRNNWGQLGYGDTRNRGNADEHKAPPIKFRTDEETARKARMLSLSSNRTCVLLERGCVRCWGRSRDGGLGLFDGQLDAAVGDDSSDMPPEDVKLWPNLCTDESP